MGWVPGVCTLHAPEAARILESVSLLHDEKENHYESMKKCHFGLDAVGSENRLVMETRKDVQSRL